MKTFSELVKRATFVERYRYLKLTGFVGEETFGNNRYLNQKFYRSHEWQRIRNFVITRDLGCDLGIADRPIFGKIIIHHIEPITEQDILNRDPKVLDPENLICVSHNTHLAIHYGDESLLYDETDGRYPGDTRLW